MNILTYDIEEWAIAKTEGYGTTQKYAEYDEYLNRILDVLDSRSFKATFFCTGMMAKEFPNVVKLILSRGHEIGCHSNRHTWMNKLTEDEAREDTHIAVDSLEQCIGQKILCYRAPAFSIGENNKWMFDILANEGITTDSSIYPAVRDFGGFPSFTCQEPCIVKYNDVSLKEYPISMTQILGKQIAYSGGGYFRFLPLKFIIGRIKKSGYTMCYFHIKDLLIEKGGVASRAKYEEYYKEPGTLKNRYLRYLKANVGKRGAFSKMIKLVKSKSFVNMEEANNLVKWEEVPMVDFTK